MPALALVTPYKFANWPAVGVTPVDPKTKHGSLRACTQNQKDEFMTDDTNAATDFVSDESPHFSAEQPPQEFAAWEEVDKGRFMPRRVRGSNPGRALG